MAVLVHDVMYENGQLISCSRKAIVMAVLVHDVMYEDGHSVWLWPLSYIVSDSGHK